jgi:flavin reductase (DIM6/NTAB) family NADH-FMN oxidoreductase RutF
MDALDFHVVRETADLNKALYQVTHGLYILTSAVGDRINGKCIDALMQVTNMPPRLAIGINKRSLTTEMIAESGIFTVNVVDRQDPTCYDCVKHFGFQSGRKVEKFVALAYERGELGAPILACAKAFFECRVVPEFTVDLGTHLLYVGELVRAGTREAGEPLTYNEYRRTMKKET